MRLKPYTQIGIRRIPCFRCGNKPSVHQWQICADGNQYRTVCARCDVALNKIVLKFMGFKHVDAMMREYLSRD